VVENGFHSGETMSELRFIHQGGPRRRKTHTPDCKRCVIMSSLRANGVPAPTIDAVCDRMWLNRVRRKQILYGEGNGATHLFAIRSGKVKLIQADSAGQARITAVLSSGDLFGFEAVFDDAYKTGAEALTECELCLASADDLTQLLHELPRVATDLARYLHVQLTRARTRQVTATATSAAAKMASYLLSSGPEDDTIDDEMTVANDLTLADLGGILGMSPETACRVLSNLKSRGIVETVTSGFRVTDVRRLRRVAGW
jgi:CRP-like cAMP-binding protein